MYSQYLITANLDKVNKLFSEDPIKHAAKISNLLLWIATFHPDLLEGEAKKLDPMMFIKCLYFPHSWEFPDQLLPTNALITLLRSRVCDELQTFCGYVSSQVVKNLPTSMYRLKLALGMHTDIGSILKELEYRRTSQYYDVEMDTSDRNIEVHFRCGEVDIAQLSSLPDNGSVIHISEMTAEDVPWVVQAVVALKPSEDRPALRHSKIEKAYVDNLDFEALLISRTTMTTTGVEALAEGLFDAGISLEEFAVASPHFDYGFKNISDWQDEEDKFLFADLIKDMYKYQSGFTEEEGFLHYIQEDSF